MKEINIEISGVNDSGKTCVSRLIQSILKEDYGFDVVIVKGEEEISSLSSKEAKNRIWKIANSGTRINISETNIRKNKIIVGQGDGL